MSETTPETEAFVYTDDLTTIYTEGGDYYSRSQVEDAYLAGRKSVVSVPTADITLSYTCRECEEEGSQPLVDIVDSGTLICPECGDDMRLDSTVTVG